MSVLCFSSNFLYLLDITTKSFNLSEKRRNLKKQLIDFYSHNNFIMANIKYDLIHGVFWSAIEKYSGLFVSIFVTMILARLLSPAEYGVVAIATVVIQFLQMFCSMGIGPAIIQKKSISQYELDTLFSLSLYVGGFFSLLLFFSSWGIADFYGNKQLVSVMQILTINLFFASANMVPNALIAKNKEFKLLAKRTLFLQGGTGVLSVVAAIYGLGVYSLLLSPVISSIGIFCFNRKFYKVNFTLRLSLKPIKSIFSFSFYQFAFEFFNYFSRNLDKLIIGKYLNAIMLGYYEKSYRLMQLPLNNVSSVVNPVIQPVLSCLQDDKKEIAIKNNKIVSIISMISFPIAVCLYVNNNEIIEILYGDKWLAAAPVFKILALSIPTQMILSTSGAIWQSSNCPKQMFWTGMLNTLITISGFVIAVIFFKTIESIALAWSLSSIVNFFNTYIYMYKKVLKSSFRAFLKPFLIPGVAAVFSFVIICVYNYIFDLDYYILNLILRLLISIFVTLLIYMISGRFDYKTFKFHNHEAK